MKAKTLTASLTAASLLFAASSTAFADYGRGAQKAKFDYAKVISAEPIVRYVTVKTPQRECWEETRTRVEHRGSPGNPAGTLVGAVIGGVVGHQFGSGRGNDAATVAGALIGAAVGNNSSKRAPRETVRYEEPVQRCETTIVEREEERIDGYRVVYRYQGQRYATRMPYDPGDKLRVRVDVRPAD